jgi:hypothetical protein
LARNRKKSCALAAMATSMIMSMPGEEIASDSIASVSGTSPA